MTARQAKLAQAGFSLVELLVAVFVMALASTVIILSAPRSADPAASVANQLPDLVAELVQGAVLTGETRSLLVGKSSIRLQTWSDGDWKDLPASSIRLEKSIRAQAADETSLTRDKAPEIRITADRTGYVLAHPFDLISQRETWRVDIAADGATKTERSDG